MHGDEGKEDRMWRGEVVFESSDCWVNIQIMAQDVCCGREVAGVGEGGLKREGKGRLASILYTGPSKGYTMLFK